VQKAEPPGKQQVDPVHAVVVVVNGNRQGGEGSSLSRKRQGGQNTDCEQARAHSPFMGRWHRAPSWNQMCKEYRRGQAPCGEQLGRVRCGGKSITWPVADSGWEGNGCEQRPWITMRRQTGQGQGSRQRGRDKTLEGEGRAGRTRGSTKPNSWLR